MAYRAGTDLLEVKHHGLWASDAFWGYITALCTSTSHGIHPGSSSHRHFIGLPPFVRPPIPYLYCTCYVFLVTNFTTLSQYTYHVFISLVLFGIEEAVRQASLAGSLPGPGINISDGAFCVTLSLMSFWLALHFVASIM